MRTRRIPPIEFKGLLIFLALLLPATLCSAATAGGKAAAPAAPRVPNYFNPRERVPLPDLSGRDRVRFLTTTDFPPFNFLDQTGRLSGFNIDLARGICEELKIVAKCQIQALPWAELEQALSIGQGEAVIAGLAITAKAREKFSFTRAYLQLPARFVRNRAVTIGGATPAALDGRRVGVVKENAHEAMLHAFFPSIDAVSFPSRDAMLAALKARKVDAVFGDGMQLSFWLASKSADGCCSFFGGPFVSEHFLGQGLAIAVRNKDHDLAVAFDHALLAMSRDGRFADIYRRYFPNGMY